MSAHPDDTPKTKITELLDDAARNVGPRLLVTDQIRALIREQAHPNNMFGRSWELGVNASPSPIQPRAGSPTFIQPHTPGSRMSPLPDSRLPSTSLASLFNNTAAPSIAPWSPSNNLITPSMITTSSMPHILGGGPSTRNSSVPSAVSQSMLGGGGSSNVAPPLVPSSLSYKKTPVGALDAFLSCV